MSEEYIGDEIRDLMLDFDKDQKVFDKTLKSRVVRLLKRQQPLFEDIDEILELCEEAGYDEPNDIIVERFEQEALKRRRKMERQRAAMRDLID